MRHVAVGVLLILVRTRVEVVIAVVLALHRVNVVPAAELRDLGVQVSRVRLLSEVATLVLVPVVFRAHIFRLARGLDLCESIV